jgi:DNA polymerase III subunit gamma/tau
VTALYRKYRPLDFTQVVGQEAVVRTLRNALEHDQVRQAYLFAGPRGTGKTSMARILAKALNAVGGPNPDFDPGAPIARAIADGSSLDVVEMDAASQRGIDEVREIRERAMLRPAEGQYKVYIVDEAHQLTNQAWNALLKLIEEPPPHLVFVFCTTDLAKVIPTVRSRCQTFVFQRPRMRELVQALRTVCEGEGIDAPDAALSLIARSAGGAYRDAISTLDQLSAATGKTISVQDVLQLGAAVEEDVLFRLCDTIVDRDVAGALVSVEELAERGLDLAQLTRDLLEHLRHLLLVQHLGHVPDSLPLTEEARERLREQANQLPEPTVVRLIDLLAVVLDDGRQGGDPRLPLELALVKVTRPQSDLARESLVHRVELLESRVHAGPPAAEPWGPSPVPAPAAGPAPPEPESSGHSSSEAPDVSLEQMQDAWTRSIIPAVKERSIPVATLLAEASPSGLDGDTLTLSFRPGAEFHRKQAEEPNNVQLLRDALHDVTGRRMVVVTSVADSPVATDGDDAPLDERGFIALLESDLDATEVEESP